MAVVLVAFALRLWAIDLAPFGERQAAELQAARGVAAAAEMKLATPGLLTWGHAALLTLTDRVEVWLGTRALMDAVAVWLVYAAGRVALGSGPAIAAAAAFAAAPSAWTAARDPSIQSSPLLVAAALWLAMRVARGDRALLTLPLAMVAGLLALVEPTHLAFGVPLVATVLLAQPPALVGAALGLLYGGLAAWPAARLFAMDARWTPESLAAPMAALGSAAGMAEASRSMLPVRFDLITWVGLALAAALAALGAVVTLRHVRAHPDRLVPLLWGLLPLGALAAIGHPSVDAAGSALPAITLGMAAALTAPRERWWAPARQVAQAAMIGLIAGYGLGLADLVRTAGEPGDRTAAPLAVWNGLAAEVVDAAERTGATELLVVPTGGPAARAGDVLAGILGPRVAVRSLPEGTVPLPLDREALYLLLPGAQEASALARPSARFAAVRLAGSEQPIKLVSLRPRPAPQWLVRADAPIVHYADGAFVLVPSAPPR